MNLLELRLATTADVPHVVSPLAQLGLGNDVREGDPHHPRYVAQFQLLQETGGAALRGLERFPRGEHSSRAGGASIESDGDSSCESGKRRG